MIAQTDRRAALELLAWQVELGADMALSETPLDRYALSAPPMPEAAPASPLAAPPAAPHAAPAAQGAEDPLAAAEAAAGGAADLASLRAALDLYPHCALRHGARQLVFADGRPGARLMIVGEAPGREEDREGRPFVGQAGRLLDKMLAAIGLSRHGETAERAVYIANVVPWRPPENREPSPEEIAMMRPFLDRHIALAAPDILACMGNTACAALLGRRGITRLRGQWVEAAGRPCLAMFHPAYLIRNPAAKRAAWADLLALKARLAAR